MPASRSIAIALYSLHLILLGPSEEYTKLPHSPTHSHLPKNHHALSIGAAEAMNPAILGCAAIRQIDWTVLENGLGRE